MLALYLVPSIVMSLITSCSVLFLLDAMEKKWMKKRKNKNIKSI